MKLKHIISIGALLALAAALYVLSAETVIHTVLSQSGKMKAEILRSRTWSLGTRLQLRITRIETGISTVRDEAQFEELPDTLVGQIKLKWRSDTNLVIELPNHTTQMIWLNEVGPPP